MTEEEESVVCLETQGVRRHHSSVLHHGRGDGAQVLEESPGVAGVEHLDVVHDSVVGLGDESSFEATV